MWYKVKLMAVFADIGDQEEVVHAALANGRAANLEWFRVSFAEAMGAIHEVLQAASAPS